MNTTTRCEATPECASCGAENLAGLRYCSRCGYRQGEADGSASLTQAPPRLAGTPPRAPDPARVLLPGRPSTAGLVVLSLVVGALLVLTVPILVLRGAFYAPGDVVTGYFEALADRDADAVWERLAADERGDRGASPMLANTVLRDKGYTPPDRVRLVELDVEGTKATAAVAYRVAGGERTMRLDLTRTGSDAGLLDRWRIVNGLLTLDVPFGAGISRVAGVPVETLATVAAEQGTAVRAFPGGYALGTSESPLAELPVTVLVAGDQNQGELRPVLRATALKEIDKQVRSWLDQCAARKELRPAGCPFGYSYYGETSDVSWKILTYPRLFVELNGQGGADVTGSEGTAEVSGRTTSSFDPTFQDQTTFYIRGTAVAEDGSIRFVPDE